MRQDVGNGEIRFESALSYVLIGGVILSLLLEVAGIITFYIVYRNLDITEASSVFIHGHDFFSFIYTGLSGSSSLPIRLMLAGLVVLMLTPYSRVILSVAYFARVRDKAYILITLSVLIILTVSLILH